MRVFVAVEISQEVREQVAQRVTFLRDKFPSLRVSWEKPEKLHLTLKFLGETDESRLPDLVAATEKAVQNSQPFELAIEKAGAFPSHGAARVLWLDVKDIDGNLKKLNEELENVFFKIGFAREKREFKPHLTIARLKELQNSRELVQLHLNTDFPTASFAVDKVIIFESKLTPQGSIYKTLSQTLINAVEK